jgi:hypothetical protein
LILNKSEEEKNIIYSFPMVFPMFSFSPLEKKQRNAALHLHMTRRPPHGQQVAQLAPSGLTVPTVAL